MRERLVCRWPSCRGGDCDIGWAVTVSFVGARSKSYEKRGLSEPGFALARRDGHMGALVPLPADMSGDERADLLDDRVEAVG